MSKDKRMTLCKRPVNFIVNISSWIKNNLFFYYIYIFREQLSNIQKRAATLQAEKDELANQAETVCYTILV